jgi:hypothetical protein
MQAGTAASTAPLLETEKVSGDGGHIQLDLKLSPSVRGFETSEYAVRRKPSGGFFFAPISVERKYPDRVEQAAAPLVDYLQFPASAAFFRLIYKAEDNGVTAVVLGAATHAQLDLANCGQGAACITLPKAVAINPVVSVTVNGTEMTFGVGMRIWNAVMKGGVRRPPDVLPTLKVWRPYGGRLTSVEFNPASEDILNMKLSGGESIAWQ